MARTLRRFVTVAATVLALTAAFGVTAAPASAWYYGNSYIVVGNWNCVGGGKVIGIFGAVDQTWTGGDWGDNIIYPRVRVGLVNTFNGRAYCDRPWYQGPDYWINVTWKQFRPTANRQTFWF